MILNGDFFPFFVNLSKVIFLSSQLRIVKTKVALLPMEKTVETDKSG